MQTKPLSESLFNESALERCRSYLLAQFKDREAQAAAKRRHGPGPAITISRETGCGTPEVVEALARLLQKIEPNRPCAWTVFDRHLMEKVLEEHNLPKELAKYMPEDRRSLIQDTLEELLGVRPPSWVMVPRTVETILHLVEMGHVIIVGRGANVITARTPNVFHVRLVAPLAQRIDYLAKANHVARAEAAKLVGREDRGRARFVKTHFKTWIDDPLLYHAVINTGRMSYGDAAQLIADGAQRHFRRGAENT